MFSDLPLHVRVEVQSILDAAARRLLAEARQAAEESAREQGLPERITEPSVVRQVAALAQTPPAGAAE